MAKINITKEMKNKLSPEQLDVCFYKGTEIPFTGRFLHNKKKGVYMCVVCGNELFSSAAKFESGTGWPSFYDVAKKGNVELQEDTSHGMARTEVVCSRCGSHLGHMFHDGPSDKTGLRYCINSAALDFRSSRQNNKK